MNLRKTLACALFSTLLACGGGGGGEFAGPANVSINAEPRDIDGGDTMTITAYISDVIDEGISVKIRVPEGLSYVTDSGFLLVNGLELNLDPAFHVTEGGFVYLVYFISRGYFGDSNYGELIVQFKGTAAIESGVAAVDVDRDDPNIPNRTEFAPASPNFTEVDSKPISVSN